MKKILIFLISILLFSCQEQVVELDIPFPFLRFEIESECVVEQTEPPESIKT